MLIAALDQGIFGFGIVSTLAMSAGVAITICIVGLASISMNRKLVMQPPSKRALLRNARRHLALALGWKALALV